MIFYDIKKDRLILIIKEHSEYGDYLVTVNGWFWGYRNKNIYQTKNIIFIDNY